MTVLWQLIHNIINSICKFNFNIKWKWTSVFKRNFSRSHKCNCWKEEPLEICHWKFCYLIKRKNMSKITNWYTILNQSLLSWPNLMYNILILKITFTNWLKRQPLFTELLFFDLFCKQTLPFEEILIIFHISVTFGICFNVVCGDGFYQKRLDSFVVILSFECLVESL